MTLLPCSDDITCDEEISIALSQNHDHSNDKNDFCTPFCICTCCSISIAYPDFETGQSEKRDLLFSYSEYFTFNYSHGYFKNVWHPPSPA